MMGLVSMHRKTKVSGSTASMSKRVRMAAGKSRQLAVTMVGAPHSIAALDCRRDDMRVGGVGQVDQVDQVDPSFVAGYEAVTNKIGLGLEPASKILKRVTAELVGETRCGLLDELATPSPVAGLLSMIKFDPLHGADLAEEPTAQYRCARSRVRRSLRRGPRAHQVIGLGWNLDFPRYFNATLSKKGGALIGAMPDGTVGVLPSLGAAIFPDISERDALGGVYDQLRTAVLDGGLDVPTMRGYPVHLNHAVETGDEPMVAALTHAIHNDPS